MERSIPRYQWVYNSLKTQIEVGDYKVGDLLPPEPDLQKKFQVSRTTVRKAVEMLAQQGFLYTRQGRGTEVLDFKATQKLQYVTSFSETLREQGFTVAQTGISVDFVPAPRHIASDLKLDPGDRLLEDRPCDPCQRHPDRPHDQLPRAGPGPGNRETHGWNELSLLVP